MVYNSPLKKPKPGNTTTQNSHNKRVVFYTINECGIKSIFLSKSRRFKFLYRS